MKEDINMNLNHFEYQRRTSQPDSMNSISVVNVTSVNAVTTTTTLQQQQTMSNSVSGDGVGFRRLPCALPLQNKNVKPRRNKCIQIFLCTPSKLYLIATILLTALASFLLSFSLTSEYWEVMVYDPTKINDLITTNDSLSSHVTISWLFSGKVPKILFDDRLTPNQLLYLLPIRSGVWTSCIDVNEIEYDELKLLGYDKPHCVDHLQTNVVRPTEVRASWQHRMQNLAIACATVCLILLGSAVLVGLFGVFRPQISAVLVTGVIYMLATLFAVFTLAIVHLKHKNRKDREPLDVWTRLIQDNDNEFQTTRHIHHGWSLKLAWAGNCVCLLASVMWVILSKIMRYNPNPLSL